MMKSVDFETRECFCDGGSASPTSLEVEMITHLDVETALRCCQRSRIVRHDVSVSYEISFAFFTVGMI